jgi:hypothetical protein
MRSTKYIGNKNLKIRQIALTKVKNSNSISPWQAKKQ